ncbi:hypothetical protein GR160_00100 [Flavobacterium sp. Sd200]|uniref:hypothetical protein n=1 Tax=Flavobacterium sp. Sd200 TaxID=2692211 RepID=UPI00136E92D1|nr:hypothetical protein [Flavobacterium sp. Sd200]MXN89616.1 hypothetical protein [Flavobacterium sp. Sd200]
MQRNKYILVQDDTVKVRYRNLEVVFRVRDIESISIIKTKHDNGFVNLLLGTIYWEYYLKIKIRENAPLLEKIKARDRKQLSREVVKVMDYTFPLRMEMNENILDNR